MNDIDLGKVSLDPNKIRKQIRQDLKDDWFKDPLNFEDMLQSNLAFTIIQENFEINHGDYQPMKRDVYNVPKPNFTLRYALETSIEDRLIYHGLVFELVQKIDKMIPWFIFSHRKDPHIDSDRYMFRRGIPAWKDFTETVKASINEGDYLLSTDLVNYFENIDLNILKSQINDLVPELEITAKEKSYVRGTIETLFTFLNCWSYRDGRGLPQNRDASSFLANVYMLPIDLEMQKRGYTYFRYMDDIKVICDSKGKARQALKDLCIELRKRSLAVNSKKTAIIDSNSTDEISEYIGLSDIEIEQISAKWDTKDRDTIISTIPMLVDKTEKCLVNNDANSRLFRFCIMKLWLVVASKQIKLPAGYFDQLAKRAIEVLPDNPMVTDQIVKFLSVVELTHDHFEAIINFLNNKSANLYEWQEFQLWCLLAKKNFISDEALILAKSRLDEIDDPRRSGATLYLGCISDEDGKNLILTKFSDCKTFFGQRCAIIALKDMNYSKNFSSNIVPFLRKDLKGVYRNLNRSKLGFFSKDKKPNITDNTDWVRDSE